MSNLVRVDEETYATIKRLAQEEDRTLAVIVKRAVKEYSGTSD